MLEPEFHLDDFPPVSYAAWRAQAEADLGGASFEQKLVTHTYEGIDLQPVYTRHDHPGEGDPEGFPGLAPFVRGSQPVGAVTTGWDLCQEHAHPDLGETNKAIHADVQGGTTSLLLRLDFAARNGLDPDDPAAANIAGRDGIMAYHINDFDAALEGVNLSTIAVTLEAGAAFLPAAGLLVALWRRRRIAPAEARGAFNADPIAVVVRDGHLPYSAESGLVQLADLAAWTANYYPHVTAVRVGTAPYHHAGASAAQDIAFGAATGVEYLRAMTEHGLDVARAARQIQFSISLGTHHFLALAKLRAARRVWSRVIEASGGPPEAGAMRVHARVSKRVLTLRDPYVNLLRNMAACFAAGLAGAEAITSVPFDVVAGLPSDLGRRIARNTVHILQEEAQLSHIIDPAGGSWYLDYLTDRLAEKAWSIFQEVEREGGMLRAVCSGWVALRIESAFAPRARNLACRKEGITGVSEFPDLAEERVVGSTPDRSALQIAAARQVTRQRKRLPAAVLHPGFGTKMKVSVQGAEIGATIGQLAHCLEFFKNATELPPLTPHPFAEPFEALRQASDLWREAHGTRPRVFLANVGSAAQFSARAGYAKNFFEAGGFEVEPNNGFKTIDAAVQEFSHSRAKIVAICSSDTLYSEIVPQLAARLKQSGARSVVLVGNPGANETAWRANGVDRFIFVKCDVLAALREMLREEGILMA